MLCIACTHMGLYKYFDDESISIEFHETAQGTWNLQTCGSRYDSHHSSITTTTTIFTTLSDELLKKKFS